MTYDMTFDESIDVIREKILSNHFDDEYKYALNVMSVMWDQDYANRVNHAVAPTSHRPIPDDTIYILLVPSAPEGYLILERDRHGKMKKGFGL